MLDESERNKQEEILTTFNGYWFNETLLMPHGSCLINAFSCKQKKKEKKKKETKTEKVWNIFTTFSVITNN